MLPDSKYVSEFDYVRMVQQLQAFCFLEHLINFICSHKFFLYFLDSNFVFFEQEMLAQHDLSITTFSQPFDYSVFFEILLIVEGFYIAN